MTIYLKGEGYAKNSAFGNPTVIGSCSDQVIDAIVNIKRFLTWGEQNLDAIHTLHISYDAGKLNPRPEFYKKREGINV